MNSIQSGAFGNNQLPSVVIPEGVITIDPGAFESNQITTASLPASLTSDVSQIFGFQGSPSALETWTNIQLESLTPAEKAEFESNIWYVRVYTSPGNPNNLKDHVDMRNITDSEGNPTGEKVMAFGHLINPSSITLSYTDSNGAQLQASQTVVGVLSDGTFIHDYLGSNGPDVADTSNPTGLSAYYRLGQSVSLTAPDIAGYTTPSPATKSFVLGATTNSGSFVYTPVSSTNNSGSTTGGEAGASAGGTLLETGVKFSAIAVVATLIIASSLKINSRNDKKFVLKKLNL